MANSEVQVVLMMMLGQSGLLLLHHSLHTSLLQCPPDCLFTDKCMGDVPQGFLDPDSIVCLFSADKVDDMVNIGGGKLGRAATNGLGDGRAVFLMDSGDGGKVPAHRFGDLFGRLPSMRQGEDRIGFISGEWFHDDGGCVQVVVVLYLVNKLCLYINMVMWF